MNVNLNDRKILVTGASRGIGKAIAIRLASSGARVIATSTSVSFDHEHIQWFHADFNQLEQVSGLVRDVIKTQGRIDGLVNNAGLAIYSGLDASDADFIESWERTMRVNLTATALLSREMIRHFKNREVVA